MISLLETAWSVMGCPILLAQDVPVHHETSLLVMRGTLLLVRQWVLLAWQLVAAAVPHRTVHLQAGCMAMVEDIQRREE